MKLVLWDNPSGKTAYTAAQVLKDLAKANEVWKKAGIQFVADGAVTENAASATKVDVNDEGNFWARVSSDASLVKMAAYTAKKNGDITVDYVPAITKEAPDERPFFGFNYAQGATRWAPVTLSVVSEQDAGKTTLAHELGHILLGPDHVDDKNNLMYKESSALTGEVGTELTGSQIEAAREAAARIETEQPQ